MTEARFARCRCGIGLSVTREIFDCFEELADASLCKILGITCQHASSELHGPKRVDAFPCDLVFRTRGCVSVQDAEQAQLIETLGEIRPDTRILLPKRGQPALISPRRQAEKRSSRASVRNVIRAPNGAEATGPSPGCLSQAVAAPPATSARSCRRRRYVATGQCAGMSPRSSRRCAACLRRVCARRGRLGECAKV